MVLLSDLEFAQKFPFSETGKRAVRELNVPLDSVSENAKKSAIARIKTAFARKPYFVEHLEGHKELLEEELLSFPIAKIYISIIGQQKLFSLFAKSHADAAFELLEREKGDSLKIRLAQELNLRFSLPEDGLFSVKVLDFLNSSNGAPTLKLVNQRLEKGSVLLESQRFARLLSEKAFSEILASLPVKTSGIPERLKEEALALSAEFRERQAVEFKKMAGKTRLDFFPPCMEKMYSELLSGKNLPHFARFDLTTFLNAVGMPEEEIIKSFSKAPNFDESITRYQVKKITKGGRLGKGYSPASCEKLRLHSLCIAQCNVKHPTQYYWNQFRNAKKEKKGKGLNE
ncbi:MAG: hypothetical protein QXK06_01170 [Candidatus Diapherotrites archaeon]